MEEQLNIVAQNVRRGFNPHGDKKSFFFINLVIMYWTLNSIYMQFGYQYPKSSNVSVKHVQLLRGMFGSSNRGRCLDPS